MDRQARKLAVHREEGSEGGSELGSNTDSDSDEKVLVSFITESDMKLMLACIWVVWIFVLIVPYILMEIRSHSTLHTFV
jgi:hypothetical protein